MSLHIRQRIAALALHPLKKYSWFLAIIQGASTVIAYWYFLNPPSPGIAVAALGLVAIIMAIRVEEEWGRTERIVWLILATFLMIVEMKAIQQDRDKHENEMAEARTREETARTEANQSFAALVEEDRALFQSMQHVNILAQESLENITGGKSFAIVTPQVWSGMVPISLSIRNGGNQILTGVTVSIYGREEWNKPRGFYEAPTANVGTLHPGEMKLLKETITPTSASGFKEDGLAVDRFQLNISAQNFTVVEYLDFKQGKKIPWTFRYQITRQFVKSQHGKTTNFGYEIMASQKEWLGER